MPIGTTAPFSAMSGVEKKMMSALVAGAPPPNAFIVSSIDFVSNAALFQSSAAASPGLSHPAAASSVSSVTPPPVLSACLRVVSIGGLRIESSGYCKRSSIQSMIARISRSGASWGGIATLPQLPAPPACTLCSSFAAAPGSLR